MDKYGLKATFNLNSGKFGTNSPYEPNGKVVDRRLIEPTQVKELYKNHEVAAHTVGHFNLTELPDSCVVWQVERDREMLETLTGKAVRCMAYPCGGVNNDERVAALIKNNTPIAYVRTITSTYTFALQKGNLLRFNPTLHFLDKKTEAVVEEFLNLQTDEPQLLYIWGHSYELDYDESRWQRFEKLCKTLASREDIFYGTNKECLL